MYKTMSLGIHLDGTAATAVVLAADAVTAIITELKMERLLICRFELSLGDRIFFHGDFFQRPLQKKT